MKSLKQQRGERESTGGKVEVVKGISTVSPTGTVVCNVQWLQKMKISAKMVYVFVEYYINIVNPIYNVN